MAVQHSGNGFSLLEVLVTLVILSIGLLGLAGLQAQGLRFNHFAYMRGQTSALAYAIADRMRANRFAIVNSTGNYVGFYNETDTGGNYPATQLNGCTQTTPTATATNCTIVQMAAHDRAEWDADLGLLLAGGQGRVCVDATPATLACDNQCIDPSDNSVTACTTAGLIIPFVITVRWNESGTGVTGLGCDPDVSTDLKCFSTNFQVTP